MLISAEFVDLCQAQILLLTQSGATLSVVYLTQELVEGAQTPLVPIAAYPDSELDWQHQQSLLSPSAALPPDTASPIQPFQDSLNQPQAIQQNGDWGTADSSPNPRQPDPRQIVLPLLHDDMVLGLLVTRRDDRPWQAREHTQIETIANTLAIACVLDQRYQWLAHERQQDRLVYRQQRDLMDNLLHQFRNSLTALQTFGKLILKRLLPGDSNQDLATNLVRETDRLKELSQQLERVIQIHHSPPALPPTASTVAPPNTALKVGSSELVPFAEGAIETQAIPLLPSGLAGTPLALERCLVDTVLTLLIESATPIAQEKQLTLHSQIADDLPPVWANAQALREVLNNLLENALKYTPSGGDVWISTTTDPDEAWVTIEITDTGVGIPMEDLPRLFERHFRGAQAEGDIPGTGLGLAIAHSLLQQMHGKIQAFSPARHPQDRQLKDQQPNDQTTRPADSFSRRSYLGTTFIVDLPTELPNPNSKSDSDPYLG
jgi:signal transduction histidine kinase